MSWLVPPDWKGQAAFIIAGGTSVATQNIDALRGRRVIVINSSYEVAPWADYLFFADQRWYQIHHSKPEFKAFAGRIVTVSYDVSRNNPKLLRLMRSLPTKTGGTGLALHRGTIVSQRTSLQGAINFAFHLGANPIVLLGADMRRGDDGRSHHHTPHKWPNKPGNRTWDIQMEQLKLIAEPLKEKGVEVINTCLNSRIDWWPKRSLEDVLTDLGEDVMQMAYEMGLDGVCAPKTDEMFPRAFAGDDSADDGISKRDRKRHLRAAFLDARNAPFPARSRFVGHVG